jgi:hypothetical protein
MVTHTTGGCSSPTQHFCNLATSILSNTPQSSDMSRLNSYKEPAGRRNLVKRRRLDHFPTFINELGFVESCAQSTDAAWQCLSNTGLRDGHLDLTWLVEQYGIWVGNRHDVHARVNGNLSFAELRQAFYNDTNAGSDVKGAQPIVLEADPLPTFKLSVECTACLAVGKTTTLQLVRSIFHWERMKKFVSNMLFCLLNKVPKLTLAGVCVHRALQRRRVGGLRYTQTGP